MAPPSDFAEVLKRARTAARLSQADLATRAGLTGSYVCLLELRRRPAPSPEVVTKLAKALGLDPTELREAAALDRTPEPLRRRLAGLSKEKHRVRRSRDALLTTTLYHVTRQPGFLADAVAEALGFPEERRAMLGHLARRVRDLPSAEHARTNAGDLLKDLPGRERNALVRALPRLLSPTAPAPAAPAADAPAERTWQSVPVLRELPRPGVDPARLAHDAMHVDRRLHREGSYFLVAQDEGAYPRIEAGDYLLVDPHAVPADGDWVVWRDGAHARLRVLRRPEGDVRLESPRPDVPPIRAPAGFTPAGTVLWIFRPLRGALPARATRAASDAAPSAG